MIAPFNPKSLTETELGEIRQSYRLAKFPSRQISVLSELYLIPPEQVREIVGEKPKPKRAYVRKERENYGEVVTARYKAWQYSQNHTARETAEKFRCSTSTVGKWGKKFDDPDSPIWTYVAKLKEAGKIENC